MDFKERETLEELVELEGNFGPIYPPYANLKWQAAWDKARAALAAREEPDTLAQRAMSERDLRFPVKLSSYSCQGFDRDGESVVFDDLLNVGDRVASVQDEDGNHYGPFGVVVKREDGLWIEQEPALTVCEAKEPTIDTERPDEESKALRLSVKLAGDALWRAYKALADADRTEAADDAASAARTAHQQATTGPIRCADQDPKP